MLSEKTAAWYEDWFDSPYYSILYKHRDDAEAHRFIDRLIAFLNPASGARMLDLGCGKGRFSRYLAQQGFEVTGLDLSENSIQYARQFAADNLSFFTHDMREPYKFIYFDYIFSFFTSFGYFESDEANIQTLKNVHSGLKKNGYFVLDFFNAANVEKHLPQREEKEIGGIRFFIEKKKEGNFVVKHIRFEDSGVSRHFTEQVRLFDCQTMRAMFAEAGLDEIACFGDYDLNPFDEIHSPRLILVAKKSRNTDGVSG
jgi:SAM-dependent methyltransferase